MAGSPRVSNRSEDDQQPEMITTTAIGDHWEIQYARFFNFPLSFSAGSVGNHPTLISVTRKPKGSWLSSFTSLAYLKLLTTKTDHSDASQSVILTVTLLDNIIEEHYVSNLHFTWPQVSCMSGYPPRGSKIVFMSYKDHIGQIQKFVVRFLNIHETKRFINSLKEIFGHERIDESTSDISKSKTSTQSEIFPSTQLDRPAPIASFDNSQSMYRPTQDWSPVASPAVTSIQSVHPIEDHEASQTSNTMKAALSQEVQEKLSSFPPSFTSLLTNCYPVADQTMQPTDSEEVILKNEIMKYLEDSSFQEMLSKVQKVVSEFEDDLSL